MNGPAQVQALGGRVLLLMTALLVFFMPITESLWHFDGFLRGGQDCEFGILLLVTFLAMVLVLSQRRRQSLERMLAVLTWLGVVRQRRQQRTKESLSGLERTRHGTVAAVCEKCLESCNLPLRI